MCDKSQEVDQANGLRSDTVEGTNEGIWEEGGGRLEHGIEVCCT